MAEIVAIVDITRDRAEYPAFQRLAGGLAEGARAIVSERYDARMLYSDELSAEQLIEQTSDAAAVILLGGEDVTPEFYGGPEEYTGKGPHHREVDARQIELIRHLAAERTPTLGICRGAQIMNVALGGTLVQHLEVPGHRNPEILKDLTLRTHAVDIDAESIVGRAMALSRGARRADGAVIAEVQSAHHQAIGEPGAGLRVVARASDGVVEAVQHEEAPMVGVQWHPEDPNTSGEQVTFLLSALIGGDAAGSLE